MPLSDSRPPWSLLLTLLLLAGPAACTPNPGGDDDDSGDDDDTVDDDDVANDDDTADDDDTGDDDDDTGDDDDVGDDDDSAIALATLSGNVSRSADVAGDGIGTLIVFVFHEDPSADPANANEDWAVVVEDVDFSSASASVSYALEVGQRANPWFVVAVFDDDGHSGDAESFEPSEGDLLSYSKTGADSVAVEGPDGATLDLVLQLACCDF